MKKVNNGYFTPPQRLAIPLIHEGKNVLICSPTGSGKTLSAFTSIINELFLIADSEHGLENSVYCIYISPLKSLANDIHKNLGEPLSEISKLYGDEKLIRHAIRHGDTATDERAAMLRKTPHILNTTPESLAILLNSPEIRGEAGDGALGDHRRNPLDGGYEAGRVPVAGAGAAGGESRRSRSCASGAAPPWSRWTGSPSSWPAARTAPDGKYRSSTRGSSASST